MFRDFTIKTRMIFLLIISSVLLVGIGYLGLRNMKSSNQNLVSVYNQQIVPIRRLKIIADKYAIDIAGAINRGANGLTTFAEALEQLNKATLVVERQWDLYTTSQGDDISDEEREIIRELQELMEAANGSLENARHFLRAGDMIGLTLYAMDEVGNLVTPISSKVSHLIDVKLDRTKALYEMSMSSYQYQKNIALFVIVFGIALSVSVCSTLIRTINKSLLQVTEKLDELATGDADLTKRIPIVSKDEVGKLAENFNLVLDKLNKLVKGIQSSGSDLSFSAEKMAISSQSLNKTVKGFGDFTFEVVHTTKQISTTSGELLETMNDVAKVATNTAQLALSGQASLSEMKENMSKMEESSNSIAVKLGVISDKAASITHVLFAIFKVAERINLLSFNASIEAEKAGEYGKGFSVVAREIRRLADQTRSATTDIGKIVEDMKGAVNEGVKEVGNFSEEVTDYIEHLRMTTKQLVQIISEVQNLRPQFERVYQGMQNQAEGAVQIENSIVELSDGAKVAAKAVTETEQNIFKVKQSASDLQEEVERYKVR
ncbi:MAG: methyl-accepting chemotaxis protein [Chlamydiales bacterium]|nr:methyl-accepting chemotaxis protein [Chlamydiales bacterium]